MFQDKSSEKPNFWPLSQKEKKTTIVLGVIILVAAMTAVLLTKPQTLEILQPKKSTPSSVGWEDAKKLILDGQVNSVSQGRNLSVTLKLADGGTKTTQEPKIDAVFEVVDECGNPCSGIIKSSE